MSTPVFRDHPLEFSVHLSRRPSELSTAVLSLESGGGRRRFLIGGSEAQHELQYRQCLQALERQASETRENVSWKIDPVRNRQSAEIHRYFDQTSDIAGDPSSLKTKPHSNPESALASRREFDH